MRRFRYRLQAVLDRERAVELELARGLGAALARVESAVQAVGQVRARASDGAAREFEWAACIDGAARACVRSALAAREEARTRLLGQRRRREALSLHRTRCAAAFEASRERAAEADLELVNGSSGGNSRVSF